MPGVRLRGVPLASTLARVLSSEGFYAARHSTSILVMGEGRVVASIHVYWDECIVRPYAPYREENRHLLDKLLGIAGGLCGRLTVEERETPQL